MTHLSRGDILQSASASRNDFSCVVAIGVSGTEVYLLPCILK